MKRLFFTMVIASAMIISFYSCNKDDSLPLQTTSTGTGSSGNSTTINLRTDHWEAKRNGILVNVFSNIIPSKTNQSVNVYMGEVQINERVPFMDGVLWATSTQTDVVITYRGNLQNLPSLNIKVVIE